MAGGKPAGYLQAWPRIGTRTTVNKSIVVGAALELGASEPHVQCSNHIASCLLQWDAAEL